MLQSHFRTYSKWSIIIQTYDNVTLTSPGQMYRCVWIREREIKVDKIEREEEKGVSYLPLPFSTVRVHAHAFLKAHNLPQHFHYVHSQLPLLWKIVKNLCMGSKYGTVLKETLLPWPSSTHLNILDCPLAEWLTLQLHTPLIGHALYRICQCSTGRST